MAEIEEWPWYLVMLLVLFIALILVVAVVLVMCCFRCWNGGGTWWSTRRTRRKQMQRYSNMAAANPAHAHTSGLRLKTAVNDSLNITMKAPSDGGVPVLQAATLRKQRKYRSPKSFWNYHVGDKFRGLRYRKYRKRRSNGGVSHIMAPGNDVNSFRSLPPVGRHKYRTNETDFRSFGGQPQMRKALSWYGGSAGSDYTLVRVKNSLGETSEAMPDSFFCSSAQPTTLDTYRPAAITDNVYVQGPVLAPPVYNGHSHDQFSVQGTSYIPPRVDPADNIFRSTDPPPNGGYVNPNNVPCWDVARGTYSHTIQLDLPGNDPTMVNPTYSTGPIVHQRAHVYHGADVDGPIVPQQAQLLYNGPNVNNNNHGGQQPPFVINAPSNHM